jgi:hypothetical protein
VGSLKWKSSAAVALLFFLLAAPPAFAGELPKLLPETLTLDASLPYQTFALRDDDGGVGTSVTTFGVGIILGDPTGLTAKLIFAGFNGLQIHLGWGFGRYGRFIVIVDYLFHFVNVIPPVQGAGRFVPYVGVGGWIGVHDNRKNGDGDANLGIRFPIGVGFLFSGVPIEIFAEIALGIGLIPSTYAIVDGGLGGRYYF